MVQSRGAYLCGRHAELDAANCMQAYTVCCSSFGTGILYDTSTTARQAYAGRCIDLSEPWNSCLVWHLAPVVPVVCSCSKWNAMLACHTATGC